MTTVDPAFLAERAQQLRHEADLIYLIAGVVFDATSLPDAADRLRSVAVGKRAGAERLDEMVAEATQNSPEGPDL